MYSNVSNTLQNRRNYVYVIYHLTLVYVDDVSRETYVFINKLLTVLPIILYCGVFYLYKITSITYIWYIVLYISICNNAFLYYSKMSIPVTVEVAERKLKRMQNV